MQRKNFILGGITGIAAAALPALRAAAQPVTATSKRYQGGKSPWPICLDTATIRPAGSLEKKIEIARVAGFDAIEPWDSELAEYEKNGGNLKDLGQKVKDAGLFVPSMIGLWGCVQNTPEAFERSLPATRNRLRMASELGCAHVQAIPNDLKENFDYKFVSSCYRQLLEIGVNDYGVIPALVFVKMFQVKRLGQAVALALDADHPRAKIIPDVYHMYISDGGFAGLKHLRGDFIAIFQFNDAPKDMAREKMEDKHRVYPGDGILPLPQILQDLRAGLEKTLGVIEKAGV